MSTIPNKEPSSITAGETLLFEKLFADYPAPTWSITYSLRDKDGVLIEFTTTASGQSHRANVDFLTTATWNAGEYFGVGIITDGTSKYKIWDGRITVKQNISSQNGDPRSFAKRTLDNINAVLEGRASSSILKSVVDGTTLERTPIADLLKLRDYFAALYNAELQAERNAQGLSSNRNIYVRFGTP